MRVLVAYGSRNGGTAGIAQIIGDTLASVGVDAVVRAAQDVDDVGPYDAVIVGGGLYSSRWQKDARRFVRRHGAQLQGKQLWCFSSGPLDDQPARHEIPPTRSVARLMDRLGAREHVTFGGRLLPDVKGFIASRMAKQHSGDWRDLQQIRRWAMQIAVALGAWPATRRDMTEPPSAPM